MGVEQYAQAKVSTDKEVQRKLLIVKWLYVYGFLSADFPPRTRYIPQHLLAQLDIDQLCGS
jgi:hypothetical protein